MPAQKGFTLVELLVTISIIAVLSVVGTVSFIGIRNRALDAKKKADIDAIRKAYEQNYDPTENGGQGGYKPLENSQFAGGKIPTQPNGTSYIAAVGPASTDGGLPAGKSNPQNNKDNYNEAFMVCAPLGSNSSDTCNYPTASCYCAGSSGGDAAYIQSITPQNPPSCDPGSLSYGLVGYWKMDESSWNGTSGEVVDSSGNNNGTAESGATTASAADNSKGNFLQAGSFSGSPITQRVKVVATSALAPGQFSISFWTYPTYDTTTADFKGLITGAKGNGYDNGWRVIDYNQMARLQINTGSLPPKTCIPSQGSLARNSWSHVVATYDQQNLKVFINGNEKCSTPAAGSINYSTATTPPPMYLGYAQNPFQGRIDDVRLYNRALTPQEIGILANGCIAP